MRIRNPGWKNLDPRSGLKIPNPQHVHGICSCTVPTGPLKFQAFIAEEFSFQQHLPAFGALKFLLKPKLLGPLLLWVLTAWSQRNMEVHRSQSWLLRRPNSTVLRDACWRWLFRIYQHFYCLMYCTKKHYSIFSMIKMFVFTYFRCIAYKTY